MWICIGFQNSFLQIFHQNLAEDHQVRDFAPSGTRDVTTPNISCQLFAKYYSCRITLALSWFKSYLSGRTHPVKVGSTLSHPAVLQFGVSQGSVLGPILFSLYTHPISSITLAVVLITTSTPMTPNYT